MATRKRGNGEGSVYEEGRRAGTPTGRWVAQVVVDGKLRRTFHPTEAKAKTGLRSMHTKATAGAVTDGNVTVGQALERWSKRSLADVTPRTVETYRWAVDRLTAELGSRRLRTLSVEAIESSLDRMARGDDKHPPLGRASLVKVRSVLGQALDFAVKRGMVNRNLARLADLPPEATRTRPRRSLTVEEARQLLAALEGDRLEALFIVMLAVGLRPGEVAGLTWDGVDLETGRVVVRHGVRIVANRATLVDALKTTKARRTIELPTFAVDALRRHRARQLAERLAAASWADDRLVFTTTIGTVLEPRNVARSLERITTDAGLGKWTPNELRHSAASLMLAAGVPLEHVADLLGHTNTRMLEQTYRHAVQPAMNAAAGPMQTLLGTA